MEEAEQYCFEDFESQPIGTGSKTAYLGVDSANPTQEENTTGKQPEVDESIQNMTTKEGTKRIGTSGCSISPKRSSSYRKEFVSSDLRTSSVDSAYESRTSKENQNVTTSSGKVQVYGDPIYVNSVLGHSGFVSSHKEDKARKYEKKPARLLQRQSVSVDEDVFSVRTRATPTIVHAKSRIAKWTVNENDEVENQNKASSPKASSSKSSIFRYPGATKRTSTGLVSVSPVNENSVKEKPRPYIGLVRSTTVDIPTIGCSSTDDDDDSEKSEEQHYIPFDIFDKLSVRARSGVKSSTSKTKDVAAPPPALQRSGASSPRNWDFATQSIVPRFTKRDGSEIVSAIRKSPTLRSGDNRDRRRPVMTSSYSIDSALMPLTDSPHKGNKMSNPEDLSYDLNDKITFHGPEDVLRSVASEQGLVKMRTNANPAKKDKRRQIVSMGSLDGIMGLPPSGKPNMQKGIMGNIVGAKDDGYASGSQELVQYKQQLSTSNEHNGHKPICRSLTAPAATGTDSEQSSISGPRPKIPVGARVSAPLLGISSGGAAWRLEDEESANPPPPPSLEDTPFAGSSTQLYYPLSPRSLTPEVEKSSRSNGSLVKLARRLSQKGDKRGGSNDKLTGNNLQCRQRSVSVDSGDVRKAHSMESLVQTGSDMDKPSSIPPSPSAPSKLHRSWSGKKRNGSNSEMDSAGSKGDKNKRSSKYIYDTQALFEAVEHQDLEAARSTLEGNGLDLNQVNEEEFTALDIAVMSNNIAMAKLLLSYGARENPRFLLRDTRGARLNTLINEAERQVQDLTTKILNANTTNNNNANMSNKDLEKLLKDWEWKHRLYKRMKTGFEHARIPERPANVTLHTTSSTSLLVEFEEPTISNGAAVTRYKVEWSQSPDFCPLCGEHILYDVRNLSYRIHGLEKGTKYYVRVSAFNMKGFGPSQLPDPLFGVPSSWRDIDDSRSRTSGKLSQIDELFQIVRDARPTESGEMKTTSPRASPNQVRRTMRKSLKNFFQSAPKFQKNLKSRGVYLASMLYSEDKILVTTEDCLPVVEVDENFSSNLHQEFLWFMKVASTWEDIDTMRVDLERSNASSASVLFRGQMLSAAAQLQSALGIQDLGQLYYEPVRDQHGSTVITIINQIKDPRIIQTTSLKWSSISRMQKRKSTITTEAPSAIEMLVNSIQEKILYHNNSQVPISKGLYVGYLKLRSSVDTIRVQVPQKAPNVVPHIKLRDNPNVSKEEWEWIHSIDNCEVKDGPTKVQEQFQRSLATACKTLLRKMGVSDEEAITHRICDLEVIELNDEVCFIMLFPPTSSVCLGPGTVHTEWLASEDYVPIQVHLFELIHMATYHSDFIRRYTRLSSILEMDALIAQHMLREAFSDEEVKEAKGRQDQISDFQAQLDTTWKEMRWIMDVVQYARDKQIKGGVPLSVLCAPPPSPVESPNDSFFIGNDRIIKESDDSPLHLPFPVNGHSQTTSTLTGELQSGVLRVFPAYNSGLARGTSVKLQVTVKTSCQEITNLVIQQLNKAVESRHIDAPIYPEEQWQDFCLVAIIGGKEHAFPDNFCPLQLQNPWTQGHLYVQPKEIGLSLLSAGPSTAV